MRTRLRKYAQRFLGDDRAPSAIEYAMLVAGVGVLILAVVYMLGGGARSALEHASPPENPPTTSSNPPR
jgi:Flp pilus assembly pilin Flp